MMRSLFSRNKGVKKRKFINHISIVFILIFAAVGSYMLFGIKAADTFPKSRNVYKWPFSRNSIWNMPIGSGAQYVPSGLATTSAWYNRVTIDEENIGVNPNDPLKTLTVTDGSREGNGSLVRVPADMTANGSWNNCSTFLTQDNKKIIQGQPLNLPAGGNPSWKWTIGGIIDLKSDGTFGCHGGSRLSGIGGSIRENELTSPEPIRHALKINVYCRRFCSQTTNGYRWPAVTGDSGYTNEAAGNYYGGTNPAVKMGSLLAIKPGTDLSFITSPKLRKLATTLTDYGAYIVDNTAWDVYGIAADKKVKDVLLNTDISGDTDSKEYHRQFQQLIIRLMVVDNNSPASIGGGGTPRVPLAPCFDDEPDCQTTPTPNPSPTPTPTQSNYLATGSDFTNGVVMAASSTQGATYAAEKARDGNETDDQSRWISQPADNQSLTLDLGSSKPIHKVAYLFAGDTTKNYRIELSLDGSTFKEVATGETDNQKFTLKEHEFSAVYARYIRLTGLTRWNNNYGHSVREMGAYISDTTPPVVSQTGSVVRINAGGGSYTDVYGNVWLSDTNFDSGTGSTYVVNDEIANTNDDTLYQSERWCPNGYSIPVNNGKFKLRLHFAEINPRSGTRVFGMTAEGIKLFENYNISSSVGNFTSDIKQYDVNVADQKLDLAFIKSQGCPKISAIEVLAEGTFVADNNPPVIKNISPTDGSKLTGLVSFTADVTDDNAVAEVGFSLGSSVNLIDKSAPYEVQFDTTTVKNGNYNLAIIATDVAGNQVSKNVSVTIENTIQDSTPPSTPANLKTTENTSSVVSLSWSASTDNMSVKEYKIYRNDILYAIASNLSYRDINVKASTSYTYSVSAVDASGNESVKSAKLTVTTPAAIDTIAPTAPGNLRTTSTSANSFVTAWDASNDNVAVTGYLIYRDGIVIDKTSALNYLVTGLAPSTTYIITIRAYDAADNLSASTTKSFTTQSASTADTTPPSTPSSLKAVAAKNSQVNLSWVASTDNSTYIEYHIYRNGSVLFKTTKTSFGDATVSPNSSYTYFVRAVDRSGNVSNSSNNVTITPKTDRFNRR